jgi:hypothetical protein
MQAAMELLMSSQVQNIDERVIRYLPALLLTL